MKAMLKYLKFWLAAVLLFGIVFPSGYLVDLICGTYPAWQKAKLEQAMAFNSPPLQRIIDQLTFEIENNLETMSL